MVVLLVGNKSDLAEEQRNVSEEEVKEYSLANQLESIETSALDSTNVDEAFHMLVNCKLDTYDFIF